MLASGQNCSQIDRFFDKYDHKDGIVNFKIGYIPLKLSGFYFKLTGSSEEADLLKGLNSVQILSVEDKELNKSLNLYKEIEADGFLKSNNYDVLMEVTDKNEIVRIYGKGVQEGKLSELMLIVGGQENTVIRICGDINPQKIAEMGKEFRNKH